MTDMKLTKEEAYLAMFAFLEDYYSRGKSDEIGSMLGSMSLLQDGGTADPAIEQDWNDALERVLKGKVNAKLQLNK